MKNEWTTKWRIRPKTMFAYLLIDEREKKKRNRNNIESMPLRYYSVRQFLQFVSYSFYISFDFILFYFLLFLMLLLFTSWSKMHVFDGQNLLFTWIWLVALWCLVMLFFSLFSFCFKLQLTTTRCASIFSFLSFRFLYCFVLVLIPISLFLSLIASLFSSHFTLRLHFVLPLPIQ